MLRSTSSILSVKHILQGLAVAALTAAIVVPSVIAHNATQSPSMSAVSQTTKHHIPSYAHILRNQLDAQAEQTIAAGKQTLAAYSTTVDTSTARTIVAALDVHQKLPDATVRARIAAADIAVDHVATEAAQKAAVAAQQAAAEAIRVANTPDGAKATARTVMAGQYGWGDSQFQCLSSLWQKESGWSYTAYNASSDATGIPQALPGSKMASAGSDWKTNAATQIHWGLDYISRAYGTPCSAWSHSQSMNWY